MNGKTLGAIACVIVTLILWVEALAALLRYARAGDPGAYVVAAGVFLMLPGAVLVFIVLMSIDAQENRSRARSRELVHVPERAQLQRVPSQPAPQHITATPRPELETPWTQPRLVARETTTVRELFDSGESGALWPAIERHG